MDSRRVECEPGEQPPPTGNERSTVVYFDGNPETTRQVVSQLDASLAAYSVETSTDSSAVIDYLSKDDACCFVCDPSSPDWNSTELLETLRDTDPQLPVVLYTDSRDGIAEMIEAGATNYLQRTNRGASAALVELVSTVAETYQERETERRTAANHRSVLEALPETIFIVDDDGAFTWIGPNAEQILGHTPSELRELRSVERLFDGQLMQVETNGTKPNTTETTVTTADGEKRHVIVTARPVSISGGKTLYRVRDTGEQKRQCAPLQEKRALLESSIEAIPDAFYAFDEQGNLILANEQLEAVTGYDPAQLQGMEPAALVTDPECEHLRESFSSIVDTGTPAQIETRIETESGHSVPYELTGGPLRRSDGSIDGVVGIGRDITDRVEYEQQLAELHQTTTKLMQAQSIETIGEIVCDAITDVLDIAAGGVARYDRAVDGFVPVSLTQELVELLGGEPDVFPEDSLPERVVEHGEELVFEDISDVELPELVDTDLTDYAQFGMQLDERTVFGIAADETESLDQQTLELARILGEQTASALERLQRGQELRMKTRALDNAPVGIVISDPAQEDNPLIYVNDQFTEVTGYSKAEAIGQNCRYLQGERTAEASVSRIRTAIEADHPVSVELLNYRKDGTEFWNRVQIAPVYDDDETVTNYVGFQQDVTERTEHERELELFRSLIDQSTDSVFVEDPDTGEILDVNETAARQLGYSREELLALTVPEIDDSIATHDEYQQFVTDLREQGARTFEGMHRRKDGTTFPVEVNAAYVDLDGEQEYVLATVRDITDLKEQERVLKQQTETLQELHIATQELLTVDDERALGRSLAEHLEEAFALPATAVMRFDNQAGQLVLNESVSSQSTMVSGRPVIEPGDNPIWDAYSTGETAPLDGDGGQLFAENGGETLTAALAIPVGGFGVILAATGKADGFSRSTVESLELLAANGEAVFERMQQQHESATLSEKLQSHRNRVAELQQAMESIQKIYEHLSDSGSRETFEQGIADELATISIVDFVWIGHPGTTDTELSPEAWAGQDSGYLDTVEMTHGGQLPAQRAATQRQVVNVPSVSEHARRENWARTALACGFDSGISLPIVHDGVLYGVLTAYAGEADAFGEMYQDLFADLASLLGNSLSLLGQQSSVAGSESIELEFEVSSTQYPLQQIAAATGATVRFDTVLQTTEETVRLLVTVENGEPEQVLEATEQITRISDADWFGDEQSQQLNIAVDRPFLATRIQTHGGRLVDAVSENGSTSVCIQLPSTIAFRPLIEALSDQYPEMELRSQKSAVRPTTGVPTRVEELLTERQFEILAAAYHGGYYETPRGVTGEQLAESFDISGPVVYNHLQAIHRTILEEAFETSIVDS